MHSATTGGLWFQDRTVRRGRRPWPNRARRLADEHVAAIGDRDGTRHRPVSAAGLRRRRPVGIDGAPGSRMAAIDGCAPSSRGRRAGDASTGCTPRPPGCVRRRDRAPGEFGARPVPGAARRSYFGQPVRSRPTPRAEPRRRPGARVGAGRRCFAAARTPAPRTSPASRSRARRRHSTRPGTSCHDLASGGRALATGRELGPSQPGRRRAPARRPRGLAAPRKSHVRRAGQGRAQQGWSVSERQSWAAASRRPRRGAARRRRGRRRSFAAIHGRRDAAAVEQVVAERACSWDARARRPRAWTRCAARTVAVARWSRSHGRGIQICTARRRRDRHACRRPRTRRLHRVFGRIGA